MSKILDLPDTAHAHRFSHKAMGSICEIAIDREEAEYARQAADAAFGELDRLEQELSLFIESSDVSRINALSAGEAVRVGLATFECLKIAVQVHAETGGAFDVTIGRLLRYWHEHPDACTADPQFSAVRALTGMHLIRLDEETHSVAVAVDGVRIDLGGIGKGYALDRMAALLADWGIEKALLQIGYSSLLAIGSPAGRNGWQVALRSPLAGAPPIASLLLADRAIGGSGFGAKGRHIIDPRSGTLAERWLATWAVAPAAAVADALSTAFMLMSEEQIRDYCLHNTSVAAMAAADGPCGIKMLAYNWQNNSS